MTLNQDENGRIVVTARDVPEAITDGDSKATALCAMCDALGAALAGYAIAGQTLPAPSSPEPGEILVPVTPLIATKLALRTAMHEEGLSNVALAKRLEISEGAVRRLLNPDHASRLDGVVAALAVLGRDLIIEEQKQAVA